VVLGILGPLELTDDDGTEVRIPAGRARTVLALLGASAGQVISRDRLIDAAWDGLPPATAVTQLQGFISALRRALPPRPGTTDSVIGTVGGGYLLLAGLETDLARLRSHITRSRSARDQGQVAEAAEILGLGLALWRGRPFTGLACLELDALADQLEQEYAGALEDHADLQMQLGGHALVVGPLSEWAARYPLREGLQAALMRALVGSGRQAEALATYDDLRRRLADELGVDPTPALQDLHGQILAGDRTLSNQATAAPVALAASPAQLPSALADFTGRSEQVELLTGLLGAEGGGPGAVVTAAIAGMAGVGKSTLAISVAHRLREKFPDGQLYVSLQGGSNPVRPTEVLARFLRDLGVPETAIPADEAARSARYRTLMADRRVLVVLDDARDTAQLLPLLPGTERCAVLVTSRSTLPDLPAATRLMLDVLGPEEARALFSAIIGPGRAVAEPDSTASVLACCAGLPLAVRIVASRLASRPGWSIAHLAAKLTDERRRLAELTAGDLAIRASFAAGYDPLTTGAPFPARVFRLLGLPSGTLHRTPAIAALAGEPAEETSAALEVLVDAHLIESPAPDVYRLHDLLRSYAADLVVTVDAAADRAAALGRMLGWYAGQAVMAARALTPGRQFPVIVAVPAAAATMTDPGQALDWYEAERENLVAAVRQAASLSMHHIAAQISVAMWTFFLRTPHGQDWLTVGSIGLDAARQLGDDTVLGPSLTLLGQAYTSQGQFGESSRCLAEALAVMRRAGDQEGEAKALNSLAIDLANQERYPEALEHLQAALALYGTLDAPVDVGSTLNNIGHVLVELNRHDEALDCLARALDLRHSIGDLHGIGVTEFSLAECYLDLGRFEDAVPHFQRADAALRVAARGHIRHADTLWSLGETLAALGRDREAHDAWTAALTLLERLADPRAAEARDRLRVGDESFI
jgi:DNA-binding SARP family transcriptional activator